MKTVSHAEIIKVYELEKRLAAERFGIDISTNDDFPDHIVVSKGVVFNLVYNTIDEVSAFIEGYLRAKSDK